MPQITMKILRTIVLRTYYGGNNVNKTPEQRFWEKVGQSTTNDCWLWAGPQAKGYGVLNIGGKNAKAHRISYILHYGEIPERKIVCHHCDTPLCCNPQHLFIGTHRDNVHDKLTKGRYRHGSVIRHRKFTDDEVVKIRELANQGYSYAAIARLFPVGKSQIRNIVLRLSWAQIE